ncbi:SIR2 family protein [Natronincola ferrireducens]|uniref:Zinc-ribbon domain-containing protein n=1 Tax=Natronincola ferrireducens TaxID=393762 RepID=A0A1G8ZK12_9FIRM|nr:hypothetical protein [Natronincola ferrireducens]SDK15462.1 hypothetical protein SAMN05660472_00889 [Natronincola ferrireducens]
MGFMDKLSDALSQSVEEIGKKSSEIIEVNKLSMNIGKKEREMEKLFLELGEYVYRNLQEYNYISRDNAEIYMHKIAYLEKEIDTLEKLALNIKKIRYCPRCKEEFDGEEVSYCPICGKYIRE